MTPAAVNRQRRYRIVTIEPRCMLQALSSRDLDEPLHVGTDATPLRRPAGVGKPTCVKWAAARVQRRLLPASSPPQRPRRGCRLPPPLQHAEMNSSPTRLPATTNAAASSPATRAPRSAGAVACRYFTTWSHCARTGEGEGGYVSPQPRTLLRGGGPD